MINPKASRIVIIGASACGAKAAARIRRLDAQASITIVDQGRHISFAGCGLPYFVSGAIKDLDDLMKTNDGRVRDAQYFKQLKDVDVRIGVRAESIERGRRPDGAAGAVHTRNLATGAAETLSYDKLILALGASPAKPPIEGLELRGVHHLTKIEDAAAIAAAAQAKSGGNAVIIGAGFIGIEAAEALSERGWQVTLLERFDQVLPGVLDFEIAAAVQERLFERMVEVELGATVLRLEGDNGNVTRVITKLNQYDADLVILATGVRPNVELARVAGLAIGATGALAVNARLQTSDPAIYAGGDLVENLHLVSRRPCYAPLGSTANKHGRVIGDNVCGRATEFAGVLGTFVCKAFDYAVGASGLTETRARELGLDCYSVLAPGFDKAHYYPGAALLGIKLVVEKCSGRLLGAQAVGAGDVARRIDVAAAVMRFGGTIDDLADLDLAYAPPFAQAMDCLIAAGNVARNARDGALKAVTPAEARQALAECDDVVLLDVRGAMAFRRSHLDNDKVVNIPLDELNARAGELPRDKEIFCFCTVGLRSFSAQRMLEARGFARVRTVVGGAFMWPWKDDLA